MKKNSGARTWIVLIIVLLAGIYSVALFALKHSFAPAHWIAYGFTLLAFLLLILDVSLPSGVSKQYPMLDLPMSAVAAAYCGVQFLLGGVIAMLIPGLSSTLALAVGIALLLVYVVFVFLSFSAGGKIQQQDEQDLRGVSAVRLLTADVEGIAALTADDSLRQKLAALAEAVRYSDPVSAPELADMEQRIRTNVALLKDEVEEGKTAQALQRVQNIQRFVEERNRKCAALKK